MKEKWQEICYILSDNRNTISENLYEQKVLRVLEKLGWSQFKKEIIIRPNIHIGRQNSIEPDIVVYGQNKQPELVFEIKRPSESMSIFFPQLKSYMRQLKTDIGVLIGNEIHIYYDGNLIRNNDSILLAKIPFDPNSSKGVEFALFLDKSNYFQKGSLDVLKSWISEYEKKTKLQELHRRFTSESTKQKIIEYLKQEFASFGEEILSEVIANLKIIITCSDLTDFNEDIVTPKKVHPPETLKRSKKDFVSRKPENRDIWQSCSTSFRTYLLTWNPKRWDWAEISSMIEKKESGSDIFCRWSCGNRRDIKKGDRVFIIRLGRHPKGIFANGTVVTEPFDDEHWDSEKQKQVKKAYYIKIKFDTLINPEERSIISIEYLQDNFPNTLWTPQSSGTSIDEEISVEIENQLKILISY